MLTNKRNKVKKTNSNDGAWTHLLCTTGTANDKIKTHKNKQNTKTNKKSYTIKTVSYTHLTMPTTKYD